MEGRITICDVTSINVGGVILEGTHNGMKLWNDDRTDYELFQQYRYNNIVISCDADYVDGEWDYTFFIDFEE